MKALIFAIIMVISNSVSARNNCVDLTATLFAPCAIGEQRFFVQGVCSKAYEAESTYCASKNAPECIDLRAAYFVPCRDGKTRIYVQGRCEKAYLIEHSYCANR